MNARIVNNVHRSFGWERIVAVFCAVVMILLSPAPALAKWPTLIFPSAEGITLAKGSTYVIQWESLPGDPVNIYLCRDDPPDSLYCYDFIAVDIPNSGSYSWTVPSNLPNGTDYIVVVGVLGGPIAGSDNPFTISDSAPPPDGDSEYAAVQGDVRTGDGIPVCALVLANGQYMFSCDGTGAYSLTVPLDSTGQITLFAFADGFAPFSVTLAPDGFPRTVTMHTAAPDSPRIAMTHALACAGTPNWVHLTGTIESYGSQPLCAMVLSNGQQMFSCDASLGRYDLTVPVDQNGQVTLFGFADGFQPYSETFVAPVCGGGSPAGCVDISGLWFASETVTYTCSYLGDSETDTQSGSGDTTITQEGCNISYQAINGDVTQHGVVNGNTVSVTGPFVYAVNPSVSVTFDQNLATTTGTVNGNEIDLTGSGSASGSAAGSPFSCTGTSTATFTRE